MRIYRHVQPGAPLTEARVRLLRRQVARYKAEGKARAEGLAEAAVEIAKQLAAEAAAPAPYRGCELDTESTAPTAVDGVVRAILSAPLDTSSAKPAQDALPPAALQPATHRTQPQNIPSPEQAARKKAARELRAQGLSYPEIAHRMGIAAWVVGNILRPRANEMRVEDVIAAFPGLPLAEAERRIEEKRAHELAEKVTGAKLAPAPASAVAAAAAPAPNTSRPVVAPRFVPLPGVTLAPRRVRTFTGGDEDLVKISLWQRKPERPALHGYGVPVRRSYAAGR